MFLFKRKKKDLVKELRPGDVVQFRDPKRKMAIRKVIDEEHVEVAWIARDGKPYRRVYKLDELEVVG